MPEFGRLDQQAAVLKVGQRPRSEGAQDAETLRQLALGRQARPPGRRMPRRIRSSIWRTTARDSFSASILWNGMVIP